MADGAVTDGADRRLTHDPRLWRVVVASALESVLVGVGALALVTAAVMVLLGHRLSRQQAAVSATG